MSSQSHYVLNVHKHTYVNQTNTLNQINFITFFCCLSLVSKLKHSNSIGFSYSNITIITILKNLGHMFYIIYPLPSYYYLTNITRLSLLFCLNYIHYG
jgi:hypothetical protein